MSTTTSVGRPRTLPTTRRTAERRINDLERYYEADPMVGWAKTALMNARRRAKRKNLELSDITLDDIISKTANITHCPITGVPLKFGRGGGVPTGYSASIDRIDNTQPYSPDNIWVLSARMNALKSNCSLDELIALGEFAKQQKN